jgi:SAM-dependent methyltransferase
MVLLKMFQYLRYFFYIGIHWNWRIAFILLRHEIKGEQKYQISTTGADELKKLKQQDIDTSHATMYMPVSYELIEAALREIPGKNKRHFFDIGCGKGRAMCVAAHHGFTKVSGVDFSRSFCEAAEKNLLRVKQQLPATDYFITVEDAAVTIIPQDVDCIFLFNPFDETVMKKVVHNIKLSLDKTPRALNIIYANPLCKKLFTSNGFSETFHVKKHTYFEISILSRK